jgi:hypothetical protein
VDRDRVEREWKQLFEPVVPVLLGTELRLILVLRLDQVELGLVEVGLRDQLAVEQAMPLHGEVDALAVEERRRLLLAGLHDPDAVDLVRTAPQTQADLVDRAVVAVERVQAPVHVALDGVRQRQADRDQQERQRQNRVEDARLARAVDQVA